MTEENKNIVTEGDTVSVHYEGTFEDGSVFDSSYNRGAPINFTIGAGSMIEGFETNIKGMSLGQKKKFTISSDEAYGPRDDTAVQEIPKSNFPSDFDFTPGVTVTGSNPTGTGHVNATIISEGEDSVTLDFNHPMAGKDLTFEVEVVDLNASDTAEEV